MFVVEPAKAAVLADWAERGIAQAQDPASACVVGELAIEPGQQVLDRCCGMGTKTFQMQELVGPGGRVIAVDPSPSRCRALREMLRRRRIGNVSVRQIGMLADLPADDPGTFDRILIDVPCSNSGVLCRRPEARYAQSSQALSSLGKLQNRILDDTAPFLRAGGIMVYSTCSVWPEENQRRMAAFLGRHPQYRLVRELGALPSFDADATGYHDGGYWAVLTRD
jgi:16S rRNA (cytosine967-C5)-methyltransferase